MSEFLPLTSLLLMASALSVALVVCIRLTRAHARLAASLSVALAEERKAREQLGRDINALIICSGELGERFRHQSAKQKSLVDKINTLSQHIEGTQAVTQAERLMANGLAVEQITQMCALSRGEAALLERWKQRSNAA